MGTETETDEETATDTPKLLKMIKNIKSVNKGRKYLNKSLKIKTRDLPNLITIPCTLEITLISHYSPADLCTLSDFEDYKPQLSLLSKTFVTLRKPMNVCGVRVHLRDTSLLTLGSGASLASLGNLYSDQGLEKMDIDGK